jgi:hypothetical protein
MSLTQPAELYEILYVSTIAPDASATVVSEIIAKARLHNRALDITGLLIFDGMRFCEQMEGRQADVVAQLARIKTDMRHSHLQVVHQGPLAGRRFSRFSMGYTTLEDDDALAQLETLTGQPAVDSFLKLLSSLDLDA